MLALFLVGLVIGLLVGFYAGHKIHPIYNARMRAANGALTIGRKK